MPGKENFSWEDKKEALETREHPKQALETREIEFNVGSWHAPHNIQFSGGFKKENLKTQKVQINSTLHSYN